MRSDVALLLVQWQAQASMLNCCCPEQSSAEDRRTGQASTRELAAQNGPTATHYSHHTLIPGFQHRPHQHCSAGHHIWPSWELISSRPGKAYINASKLHPCGWQGTAAHPSSSPVQLPGVCIPLLHLALPLLNLRLPVLASRQAGHVGVVELAAVCALQPVASNRAQAQHAAWHDYNCFKQAKGYVDATPNLV
eukprot:jgi/Astpho2/6499/Aster-06960